MGLVAKLVNQGQIFRFVLKPITGGQFRQTLLSALDRSRELHLRPDLRRARACLNADG